MIQTVSIAQVIDDQKVGAFQTRMFLLCVAVLFVDGFDAQGITDVAHAISQAWRLPRGALGPTFSAGLFGLMLGAILIAPLADRIGRRRVIIGACIAFSICTLLTVWIDSLDSLLPLRFFTGRGLGAAIPNSIALASEYAPKKWRSTTVMFVASGISLGAIAAGVAAAQLISTVGWRAVFVIGSALPLLLAAALFFWLPESIRLAALLPHDQTEAKRLLAKIKPDVVGDVRVQSDDAQGGKATLANRFKEQRSRTTVLLWIAFFMSLLNVPIYIHPNTPPNAMIRPFIERGLDGAVFGFAVETGLHALRIVVSDVFDRFPKLKIVLGHLGEGLPYWLSRIDFMHGASVRANRYASQPKLARKASDYLKENFYYTMSGMAWTPPIRYVQSVMGVDRVMYAMDYPYQFVPQEVNVTDELPIGYEDLKAFYQTNAERVFKL